MEGFATMYMRMPMSTSSLPVAGSVSVDGKRVTLKFPFTGIEFELPSSPKDIKEVEDSFKIDFMVKTSTGGVISINIGYISSLKCFTGCGQQEEDNQPCLTFYFFSDKSPMALLPKF